MKKKDITIVAIDEKTGEEFTKERIEELFLFKTGFNVRLKIRKEDEV
ncbi:MAG: hypothetical protein HeimAB125_11350 [Candidatus Heimdallarchaeota archaeon AB_125]|nr:MAG: hypothetical protein HeimAB125_11350 [Candidatus Heimdallarchaeota archaeon AB_125]